MSTAPTIERVETTVFRLPMHGALQWGKSSAMSEVCHVLVQVTLSDGSKGMAEAPPRPTIYGETVLSISSVIADELAPRIVGLRARCEETAEDAPWFAATSNQHIQERLHEVKNNHAAKGALDIALHDALAQHRGLSLAEYLGSTQARLQASYILGIGDLDVVQEEARHVVEQGVRVLKVKIGRNWEADLAGIVELQSELGPEVKMYADANECLDPVDAARRLGQLAELGLLYCEEPLPVELIAERSVLRRGQHLPLIGDDSAFTLRDLRRELAFDTFDILNIKTARTGYTESAGMLQLARSARKGIMVGSQASAGLGTARAALFAAQPGVDHPCELSFGLKLREDIIERPMPLREGYVCLADVAAVKVDPDLLRDATVPLSWSPSG